MQQMLNLDYSKKDDIWLSNQKTLRKLVGILGMLLPLLLYLFLIVAVEYYSPIESISHYYYTRVSSIFVIIFSLLAIFLIIYKGELMKDFFISTLAGVLALCVIMFPTYNIHVTEGMPENLVVTVLNKNEFRENLHLFSAGAFLLCLAYMSIFIFTRPHAVSKNVARSRKGMRNGIYRTCGIIMILAILVMVAGFKIPAFEDWYNDHHMTFWMEVLAVESFGISWLIKGETLFKDKV